MDSDTGTRVNVSGQRDALFFCVARRTVGRMALLVMACSRFRCQCDATPRTAPIWRSGIRHAMDECGRGRGRGPARICRWMTVRRRLLAWTWWLAAAAAVVVLVVVMAAPSQGMGVRMMVLSLQASLGPGRRCRR